MVAYLVEDSPTQALAVKRILTRVEGLELRHFADGLEAYREIVRTPPDLLLMDLILPSLHGLALCRLLKFHESLKAIPVLVFSSITDKDIGEQVRAAGGNLFLPKPFAADVLLEKTRALLDAKVATEP